MSNSSAEEEEDGGINITLGKLIAYPVGGLLILSGLGSLITNVVSGVLILLAGIIALPIVRTRLKRSQGVSINRWATVAIVVILIGAGGVMLSPDTGQNTGQNGDGGEAELIDQSADGLVPTIDSFEAGWQGGVEEENTATYFNSETDSTLRYNVTVYSSVSEAESAMEDARPENTGIDSVSIGGGGFMTVQGDSYRIWVRTANGVCFTGYGAGVGVFSPESNAKDFAQRCEDEMTD
ncbi:hypothetical protein GCM10008995_04840 [Halobellus salinus]|uniref:Uncharacterized protein n=1 Tax=Halobellus salinus TaxID=931585 RepID=A0A830EKG9_9EURY|nr:zinc ribbon domain-containing protein [Halobellus salinus]GGI97986.1 hypothetical protein GCM10008995_04840 [Halobellus salinus]SMP06744.1 hypothetical protein SAMN06265347_102195 [Halobellus salinus]